MKILCRLVIKPPHMIYILFMVKTTVVLDDEIYKALVKEALERYGTTRKLSKLINEILRARLLPEKTVEKKEKLRVKLGKKLSPEEIEKLAEEGWDEVLGWKP